jgi:hypothetical protein
MSFFKRKKSFYDRLPVVKANRLRALGIEEGIRKAKKQNTERIKKELEVNDREWQQILDRQKSVYDRQVEGLKSEIKILTATIKELRDTQAEQLRLVRRIYQEKNKEADRLIENLNEKIAEIDRYKFAINDFISKHMAELERIKTRQEAQVIRNTEDMRALNFIQSMQSQYENLLSKSPRISIEEKYQNKSRELN